MGVIPTAKGSLDVQAFEVDRAFEQLILDFSERGFNENETKEIIRNSFFTPACGLALHTVEDAEIILGYLTEFKALCRKYVE